MRVSVPVAILIAVAAVYVRNRDVPGFHGSPSAIVGQPAPVVRLPALDATARKFTSADLNAGHVSVVNVWASWCVPCQAEAAELADIARTHQAELYGIVYEDNSAAAREFLNRTGDPFARLDLDADGREGLAWGIYGIPETFVIDRKGIVRLHYAGPIVPSALEDIIMPAIATAARES